MSFYNVDQAFLNGTYIRIRPATSVEVLMKYSSLELSKYKKKRWVSEYEQVFIALTHSHSLGRDAT